MAVPAPAPRILAGQAGAQGMTMSPPLFEMQPAAAGILPLYSADRFRTKGRIAAASGRWRVEQGLLGPARETLAARGARRGRLAHPGDICRGSRQRRDLR